MYIFQGAFWGLMFGFMIGMVRMVLSFFYHEPMCGEVDTRPFFVAKIHYMYFATFLFWVTIIVDIVISLLTSPPSSNQVSVLAASFFVVFG